MKDYFISARLFYFSGVKDYSGYCFEKMFSNSVRGAELWPVINESPTIYVMKAFLLASDQKEHIYILAS